MAGEPGPQGSRGAERFLSGDRSVHLDAASDLVEVTESVVPGDRGPTRHADLLRDGERGVAGGPQVPAARIEGLGHADTGIIEAPGERRGLTHGGVA